LFNPAAYDSGQIKNLVGAQLDNREGQTNTQPERFDDVIREYIDFVNSQVRAYMDAMGGFAGHRIRVERQVHRANRPTSVRKNAKGEQVVVWSSYEDPSKPDIVHQSIMRAEDYLAANADGGANEQQQSRAVIIFLHTYWEDEIRPRLAKAKAVDKNNIGSDIMGDLTVLRNVILHAKGIVRPDKHRRLKTLNSMFPADQEVRFSYEGMHQIFVLIKQDLSRLMLEWLGANGGTLKPDDIKDIAIQRINR